MRLVLNRTRQERWYRCLEAKRSSCFQRAKKGEHQKHIHGDGEKCDDDHLKVAEIELTQVVVREIVEQSCNLIFRRFWILASRPDRILNLVRGNSFRRSERERTRAG